MSCIKEKKEFFKTVSLKSSYKWTVNGGDTKMHMYVRLQNVLIT